MVYVAEKSTPNPMKTILLPTDFSDTTTHAFDWAQLLAKAYNATLILLHVETIVAPGPTLPVAGDLGVGSGIGLDLPDVEPIHRSQLMALANGFQAEGIRCETDLRRGAVKDVILEAAQEHNADLIITGRGHLNNFFDRLMGSSATGVARGAHCPVLVVPAGDPDELDRSVNVQTIVFTTPLEFDQNESFAQVVELARRLGATLRVLHVNAENQPDIADDAEMLSQLQAAYGSEPLSADTIKARTVSGGIETYLDTNRPDLLVMTTRERDFLSGLLNPSLTTKLMVSTNVPLLVYQQKGDL